MGLLKKTADKARVREAAEGLRELDYALMEYVTQVECITLKAAGEIVAMHRKLRRMRYEIEVEGGIDLTPNIAGWNRPAVHAGAEQ